MAFIPHPNLAYSTVSSAPSPADSGTTVVIGTATFAQFLDPATYGSYPATVWPVGTIPLATNSEIVSVVAKGTDGTLNIARAQESSTARSVGTGDQFAATFTKAVADEMVGWGSASYDNLIKNGNFINNSTNGYGGTPDNWTGSNSNLVQGGFPSFGTQDLVNIGVAGSAIQGLWNLNESSGSAIDLSANGYHLTDNNTVGASSDGFMGNARDFEAGGSESLTVINANCANLEITGGQTWFLTTKPESVGDYHIMMKNASGSTTYKGFFTDGNGYEKFIVTGLTPNTFTSDIKMETGKWYNLVMTYDGTSALNIYANGVKKAATGITGTPTDTNGDFAIGKNGANAANYYDGLIQNAGVLSVALSDSQVKQLWARTTYSGIKLRRATSDATLSQSLDEFQVERLRGKTVTLRATAYKDTLATDAVISINDGSDSESADLTAEDAWGDLSVTKTISATATSITVYLKAKTSDGNVWFKDVALYEAPKPLPYKHSQDDWSRFPRLLRLDIPEMNGGRPYQYEEERTYSYSPSIKGMSGTASNSGVFLYNGKSVFVDILLSGTSNATSFGCNPPINASSAVAGLYFGGANLYSTDNNSALTVATRWSIIASGTALSFFKDWVNATSWTASNLKNVYMTGSYSIN